MISPFRQHDFGSSRQPGGFPQKGRPAIHNAIRPLPTNFRPKELSVNGFFATFIPIFSEKFTSHDSDIRHFSDRHGRAGL
ncbi:MAG: hypothetical protein K2N04_02590, partial [Alistipes sp.]|nr:hypothetical protein [Alistipes sp.]